MRLAIISDIHSNLQAFEAVLKEVDGADVDEIVCLGDLVGYGGDPDDCVELVDQRCDVCLVGNHDLAVVGKLPLHAFTSNAAIAASWTMKTINSDTRSNLLSHNPQGQTQGIGLFHASPRNPVWEYVLSTDIAELCIDAMNRRIALVGHSHVALSFSRVGDNPVDGATRTDSERLDISEGEWILNPGSVGQPRDGDPRASWLLLDTDRWSATWHRVDYDIDSAAQAIRAAGLPLPLSERLYYGH